MASAVLILTIGLFFVYGFRLMSRPDLFIASLRGRKPDQAEDVKKAPSFGRMLLLYISGESICGILSAARQKILHAPEETDDPPFGSEHSSRRRPARFWAQAAQGIA